MSILSEKMRRELIDEAIATGVDRERASITVDLAAQACDESLKAFVRVLDLAPDGIVTFAASELGAQLLQQKAKEVIKGTEVVADLLRIALGRKPAEAKL